MARQAGDVRAISGPPSRQTANRHCPLGRYITLIYKHVTRLWPVYLMRHGPLLANLVLQIRKPAKC